MISIFWGVSSWTELLTVISRVTSTRLASSCPAEFVVLVSYAATCNEGAMTPCKGAQVKLTYDLAARFHEIYRRGSLLCCNVQLKRRSSFSCNCFPKSVASTPGVCAGCWEGPSLMLGWNRKDHSSGLRDEQLLCLAVTPMGTALRSSSEHKNVHQHFLVDYQSDSHFLLSALNKASRMWLDFML